MSRYKLSEGVFVLNESGSSSDGEAMKRAARRIVRRARENLRGAKIKLVDPNG